MDHMNSREDKKGVNVMDYTNMANIAEEIDRQILVNIRGRSAIRDMYFAAREKAGSPLALHAAELLKKKMKEDSVVFIATGWLCRPWVSPNIAESDGPPGAASLARALHVAFGAIPVLLVEDEIIQPMKATMVGANLVPLHPHEALEASRSAQKGAVHSCSVVGFPKELEAAKKASRELIKEFSPWAVVTIEKGGMNEKGVIHTSKGFDTSNYTAKIDCLIDEAKRRGIPTIGIGDGGNEIGMGVIRECIKTKVPYGSMCQCPCAGGIAPYNETDSLIVSSISNWGAYGLEAALALLLRKPQIMHDGAMELRTLREAADAGFVNSRTGYTEPGVDGLSAKYHGYLVELLREMVLTSV